MKVDWTTSTISSPSMVRILLCCNIILTEIVYSVWLSEQTEAESRPNKGDFCKGQKYKKNYTTLFARFIPAIVGPELFQQCLQEKDEDISPYAVICTISDEVFALLLLENSYDCLKQQQRHSYIVQRQPNQEI
jgi:hypothetical protein